MAEKRRGGKPTDVLSVSLFLLEDSNVQRINKNMCSRSAIERLREMGYGPSPDKFSQEKGKIHFPFLMTTEEFKNKLVEIYPKLQNQCYLLMKADKSNKLQYLDIASYSYNPKGIYNSNLGQGRLYIRFATETEVTAVNCMPPPPKIRRIMLQCRAIRPKPAGLILSNSVSNSGVDLSQASTSVEKHHTLPQDDTMSNNIETIFPTADNDSLAESIVQCLLQNNELGLKVISGLFKKLDSVLENVSTNDGSKPGSTNANGTLTSLGSHNNLQTSASVSQSISSYPQPSDNQMTVQGLSNFSSTTLHQHGIAKQVESAILPQPDFHGTSAPEQNSPSGNTNIPSFSSSTSDISQTTMVVDTNQPTRSDWRHITSVI